MAPHRTLWAAIVMIFLLRCLFAFGIGIAMAVGLFGTLVVLMELAGNWAGVMQ